MARFTERRHHDTLFIHKFCSAFEHESTFLLHNSLLEVVYNELRKERRILLHEFQVLRMVLVFVLSLFAPELDDHISFRNKIPETLEPDFVCNGMNSPDYEQKLQLDALKNPIFRKLWFATVISGTWSQA